MKQHNVAKQGRKKGEERRRRKTH